MVSRLAVSIEKQGHEPPISSIGNMPFFARFGNAALPNHALQPHTYYASFWPTITGKYLDLIWKIYFWLPYTLT